MFIIAVYNTSDRLVDNCFFVRTTGSAEMAVDCDLFPVADQID
jgi:hypothetical protein